MCDIEIAFSLGTVAKFCGGGKKGAHLKSPLPLEGSLRRRAYARSSVWSRSKKWDAERSKPWGSVRRANGQWGQGRISLSISHEMCL